MVGRVNLKKGAPVAMAYLSPTGRASLSKILLIFPNGQDVNGFLIRTGMTQ